MCNQSHTYLIPLNNKTPGPTLEDIGNVQSLKMEDQDDLHADVAMELEALKAIYPSEFEERSAKVSTVWKMKEKPREYILHLTASDENLSGKVILDFVFSTPLSYPKSKPVNFRIEPVRGLSPSNVEDLIAALKPYAKSLVGNVMVYDLAVFTQEFISSHNTIINSNQVSFHEQMQTRQEQQKIEQQNKELEEQMRIEKEQQESLKKESLELQEKIQAVLDHKQTILKEERDLERQRSTFQSNTTSPSPIGTIEKMEYTRIQQPASPSTAAALEPMRLSRAKRGELIGIGVLSKVYKCEFEDPDLSSAVIKEIDIDNIYYLTGEGKKKINDVFEDIKKVKAIVHPQIGIVYDCNMTKGDNKINITVLEQEYGEDRLQDLLIKSGGLTLRRAKYLMMLLLQAVAFLHSNNVTHRLICSKYVAIVTDKTSRNAITSGNGEGITIRASRGPQGSATRSDAMLNNNRNPTQASNIDIRLLGPLYIRKLLDLNTLRTLELGKMAPSLPIPTHWIAPELSGKRAPFSIKSDVWDLGRLFLEIVLGPNVYMTCTPKNWKEHLVEEGFPQTFMDLLSRMLDPDPKVREATLPLMSHPFFNEKLKINTNALHMAHTDKDKKELTSILENRPISLDDLTSPSRNVLGATRSVSSRYASDFDELEFLGRGGYGEVVKARNRVDSRLYAIKKIKLNLNDKEETKRVLREVQTLSRLNHQYVVRYYTTWFEDAGDTKWHEDSDEDLYSSVSTDDYSSSFDDDEEGSDSETKNRNTSTDYGGRLGALAKRKSKDWLMKTHSDSISNVSIHFGNSSSLETTSEGKQIETGVSATTDGTRESETSSEEDDTSSDSSSAEVNALSRPNGKGKGRKNPLVKTNSMPANVRVVYIQMEYCEKNTLRDVINGGITIEESWRLFRQIAEGLEYIHSQGIFHRDLKPSNIFLDFAGNVKIGDLGLAFAKDEAVSKVTIAEKDLDIDRSLTKDVGTHSYIAPEVVSGLKYNSKVDMYSLGICFFEMLYPFSTGMQRVVVIRDLRHNPCVFPTDFDSDKLEAQKSIIEELLDHDSSKRPSAQEILQSPYLPPKLEDDRMNEALRVIGSQNNTTYFMKLLKTLFGRSSDIEKDFTYEFNCNAEINAMYDTIKTQILKYLVSIFQKHGACDQYTPLLVPSAGITASLAQRNLAMLLDTGGNTVSLPHDLTLPFSRMLARLQQVNKLPLPFKRYCIGNVYRKNPAGGQPRLATEVDFDIVTADLGMNLPEAEAVRVAFEILQICHGFATTAPLCDIYTVYINHGMLLESIFDSCGVSPDRELRQKAFNILEYLDTNWDWKTTKLHLSKLGVSQESLVKMEAYYKIQDSKDSSVMLMTLINNKYTQVCKDIIRQINLFKSHLRGFGIRCKVVMSPLLSYNATYYKTGLTYLIASKKQNRRDVIAAGGRYDYLISKFRFPYGTNRTDLHAAGVIIPMPRLISVVVEALRASTESDVTAVMTGTGVAAVTNSSNGPGSVPGTDMNTLSNSASHAVANEDNVATASLAPTEITKNFAFRRANVLVVALGSSSELLEEKYSIISELWDNGVSSEVAYYVAKDDNFLREAQEMGHVLCVFLKQPSGRSMTIIKVKNLVNNVETEVNREDLMIHILSELSEQSSALLSTLPDIGGSRQRGNGGYGGYTADESKTPVYDSGNQCSGGRDSAAMDQDVIILPGPSKARSKGYKNREAIFQKRSKQEVSKVARQIAYSDIMVLDVAPDVVESIAYSDMEVSDDELRKRFKHLASNQRDYLVQVKKMIVQKRKMDNAKFIWLCSSSNERPYLYRITSAEE